MIAANPQMKTIDIYDKNRREIRDEEIFPERAAAQTAKTETSAGVKNGKNAVPQSAPEQTEQPWKQEPEMESAKTIGR